ncbi:Oxo-4-hydroxy-4-carboxy-5-ureidoimidazoline decarboxylase [Chaetomium strumarium]|uniref:Oxo-4-hydroxy-4-carboxy-5-ureidoimidazoline decarboxylase n=1 Tax=Chaetomium strumarium TaxID=1170767 RepID=A0AAJ0GKW4_9PEZI|nr:Oxo-4-hydroxy-4-carboxy-5-ureidoimidazoline decarboxylase [Chaetomium strumarium]
MTTPSLPPITTLPTLPDSALTSTLDLLFEPSPALHALALPTLRARPYPSYNDLIMALSVQLMDLASSSAAAASAAGADTEGEGEGGEGEKEKRRLLHSILGSHPRLGEKKEVLSGLSSAEQRHLNQESDPEGEVLARLNREYEAKYPGLRFVTWVRGRGREEVMDEMRRRIGRRDFAGEERESIKAMCQIAADRARKLLREGEDGR